MVILTEQMELLFKKELRSDPRTGKILVEYELVPIEPI
jgi:hypothetical protein